MLNTEENGRGVLWPVIGEIFGESLSAVRTSSRSCGSSVSATAARRTTPTAAATAEHSLWYRAVASSSMRPLAVPAASASSARYTPVVGVGVGVGSVAVSVGCRAGEGCWAGAVMMRLRIAVAVWCGKGSIRVVRGAGRGAEGAGKVRVLGQQWGPAKALPMERC